MGLGTAASTAAGVALGPIGWASLAINTGLSAYQMIQGAANKAEANAKTTTAVNELINTKAKDEFANLTVPMKGYELAQQNIQARDQALIRAAQESGSPVGVIGAVPGITLAAQQEDQALAANVEQAQSQLQMQKAANKQDIENARINALRNLRLSQIQGGQAMYTQGANEQSQGMAGIAGAFSNAAYLNAYMKKDNFNPPNPNIPPSIPASSLGMQSAPPPGITNSYLQQQGASPIGAVINQAPNWQNNYNNFTPTVQPTPGVYNGMYQTGDPLYDMYMNNLNR